VTILEDEFSYFLHYASQESVNFTITVEVFNANSDSVYYIAVDKASVLEYPDIETSDFVAKFNSSVEFTAVPEVTECYSIGLYAFNATNSTLWIRIVEGTVGVPNSISSSGISLLSALMVAALSLIMALF